MKFHHYLFILSLFILSFALNIYVTKTYLLKIKVVDLTKVLENEDLAKKVYSGQLTPEEALREQIRKMEKIRKILNNESGLVLLRQCVLAGNYEDITDEVKRKIMH